MSTDLAHPRAKLNKLINILTSLEDDVLKTVLEELPHDLTISDIETLCMHIKRVYNKLCCCVGCKCV